MIDLNEFGKYRMGLTSEEIDEYLREQAKATKYSYYDFRARFNKISGYNTMALVDGQVLMYRHDVDRFTKQLIEGIPTYFD